MPESRLHSRGQHWAFWATLTALSEEAGEEMMFMPQAGNPASMEWQGCEQKLWFLPRIVSRHQTRFKPHTSSTGLHLAQQEGIYGL